MKTTETLPTGYRQILVVNLQKNRRQMLLVSIIALVIAAVMVTACAIFVPIAWFWVVFAIQIMNLSGAAGDLYVTVRFLRLPKDILVKDTGVAMTVYAPCGKGKE